MMFTLPKPNGGFDWVQLPAGPALVCRRLEPYARALFTTRGWALGRGREEGWGDVAHAAGVDASHLARVRQVHGAASTVHRKGDGPPAQPVEADIILTDDPGLAVAVQTADCLPILLVDMRTRAVAAAHAGWRGLAARVPRVAIEGLATEFGTRPSEIAAAVGPAIGACCYEVGKDVRVRFLDEGFAVADVERWFTDRPADLQLNPPMLSLAAERRSNHWFFDGWQCVRDQMVRAGVPPDQIVTADLCTASHADAFCSYRRDGTGAGRLAAVIHSDPSPH